MLLSEVVATSSRVAATRSRSAKIAALADLLGRLDPAEVAPATAFLAGQPRQGKVGVGWATLPDPEPSPVEAATLTVADLDHAVSRLDGLSGPGSAVARARLLTDLLGRAGPAEISFIRRLLLGELRQGALEGMMAEAVARAAGVSPGMVRRAVMLAGDLPAVAALALTSGAPGLAALGLQPLRPVQPMLAGSAETVLAALDTCGLSSVEWKLDGARLQAHRSGDEVRLFTRNLNEVTARLPGLTRVVRSLPAQQVVLDGEVLGLDDDDRPHGFQDTMSRFGRHEGRGQGLLVRFFDCLHLDGVDLLDHPLRDRLAALEQVAGQWRVPGILTDDHDEAAAFLEGALAAGHEGVMVKAADSQYQAGRRDRAWLKVKPVRSLDLVVLAAEWGHGRRQGWLSNLHLGARGSPGGFVMVGKTFKGLTDRLLAWQTGRLLEREVARHGITVEVRPELVVDVALDGVQASPRYPGGVALRFARVRRYREDKTPAEADSIEAVRALLRSS